MTNHFAFHLGKHSYLLRLKIGFGWLCLFFVVVFSLLGVWQIHRYEFKKNLLDAYQHGLTGTPKSLSELAGQANDALQFQPIKVTGEYQNALTILVQNRVYHDQLGYEVLTPVHMTGDNTLVLVDRGWISKTQTGQLPSISSVLGSVPVAGYVKVSNEYQFILGQNVLLHQASTLVIQRIDMKDIQRETHQAFYPFILRLNKADPHGFVRDWTITTVEPARHVGYAVQWFAMALTLLIAYFCFCIERVKHATV